MIVRMLIWFGLFSLPAMLLAQISVFPGSHTAQIGEAMVEIPVQVFGGDLITDMDARFQVGDGGPLVGGTNGPKVVSVSYAGSIWETAAGGFTSFFPSSPPIEQIVDPNASLDVAGETVFPTGLLFTVTLDITGFPAGEYTLLMGDTEGGTTRFFNLGQEIEADVSPGSLTLFGDLASWQEEHFPAFYPLAAFESTEWGENADPDNDGIVNCLEYAFGSDPNQDANLLATSSQPGVPHMEVFIASGQPTFQFFYSTRDAATSFTYDHQTALDITGTWTTENSNFVDLASPASIGTTGYTYHQKRYTGVLIDHRFFRIWVNK